MPLIWESVLHSYIYIYIYFYAIKCECRMIWICNRIDWRPHNSLLHFTITITRRLVFSVMLFGNVFQQWMFLWSRAQALAVWRTSYTKLLLLYLPSQYFLIMAAGHRHITSARTEQKTSFPTVTPLLRVIQSVTNNGCLSGSTVIVLSKYATTLEVIIIFVNYNMRK
jgi:hypothetical protein